MANITIELNYQQEVKFRQLLNLKLNVTDGKSNKKQEAKLAGLMAENRVLFKDTLKKLSEYLKVEGEAQEKERKLNKLQELKDRVQKYQELTGKVTDRQKEVAKERLERAKKALAKFQEKNPNVGN